MILHDLKIHHVRNLRSAQLSLHPRFNFISGPNGSGKTSVLEALYLLSCAHSFRSRELSPVISSDEQTLTVFASASDGSSISVQKSTGDATQIKLNKQFCSTTSQLAYALPCQVFYSELFQIIDAGPSERRAVLDWGLFHVKPEYFPLWKEYKKVLKHRNALLKTKAPYEHFIPWDKQLNSLALVLDKMRQEYFIQWSELFHQVLSELTPTNCSLAYYKGWDKKGAGIALIEFLSQHFESDKQRQYTQYGPHQADLLIQSNDLKAKQILSRGQQKIILIALKLAQAQLLSKNCLYLFDDLSSELDMHHQKKLFSYLEKIKGQFVITGIDAPDSFYNLHSDVYKSFIINSGVLEAC